MSRRRYYFRSVEGDTLGPFGLNVVADLISTAKVKASTPISIDGRVFKPMKSFPELATLLSVDVDGQLAASRGGSPLDQTTPTYGGTFEDVSVPKLFYHFFAASSTGRLVLTDQLLRKEIFLANGKIVGAASNQEADRLGQHMVRGGLLTAEQLKRILAEVTARQMRLGDYLIQMKILTPSDLTQYLLEQLLQKVYDVFRWRVARYEYFDGQQYPGFLLPMNLSPWEVLAEGVRRGYELEELREILRPLGRRAVLLCENKHLHINQLALNPRELRVFRVAANQQSLQSLVQQLAKNDEEEQAILAMIYLGVELDLLTFGEEIEQESISSGELPNPMYEDAVSEEVGAGLVASLGSQPPAGGILLAPPISGQEQQLLLIFNALKEQDFFARLKLERTASSSEVARAFIKVAKAHHPDSLPGNAIDSVRDLHTQIFSLYNEAQQALSSEANRQAYMESLESGGQDEKVDVGKILEAEKAFSKAEVMIRARKYADALLVLDQAITFNPDEGEFYIYRGYAQFMAKPDCPEVQRNQCIETIQKGLRMREDNVATGYLFLGNIYKLIGNRENAVRMFKRALALDANMVEATRELRLMTMREQEAKKSFWNKK